LRPQSIARGFANDRRAPGLLPRKLVPREGLTSD